MSYPPPAREKQGPTANAFPGPGNRAWFTREHLELIERWKNRDLLEESRRKNEESGESSKSENTRKTKGKAAAKSEDGEQGLKNWMAANFGASLKEIANKLDAVDKKTKAADLEREKLMKKVAELETGHNKDGGSNKKRKRVVGANSPVPERQKSRSRSRSDNIQIRQPSILVSSDEEGKSSAPQGGEIEDEPNNRTDEPVKLDDVMKMLAVIANRVNLEDAPGAGKKGDVSDATKASTVHNDGNTDDKSEESDEDADKLLVNKGYGAGGRNETGIMEYMRQRLEHYMDMNGKKVKSLYTKNGIKFFKWERKDKGAWELAKQDTDEFTKLINGKDGCDADTESSSDKEGGGGTDGEGSDGVQVN
ncbi:hypothetical protein CBR_g49144 [Chara braunii]|uniref:Uncharacterized protein n=1 Tax=Chara braunii TaxID=69332 RepID=A0A388K4T6_CHABU|nr:hypothetical protein CBR_g49144 [Chara braunii]|eukprot:GBG65072.1 hypothetical protein CBR_g49144 [Chara braunii]